MSVSDHTLTSGQSVAANSLLAVNDVDGDQITMFRLYDQSPEATSGHFTVNGAVQAPMHNIDLTPAQLAQTSFVAGTTPDHLWVQVFDGAAWSAWYDFHILV